MSLAPRDIFFLHAFIYHRALLEENHPGRNGRADVGHQKEKHFVIKPAGENGNQAADNFVNGRMTMNAAGI